MVHGYYLLTTMPLTGCNKDGRLHRVREWVRDNGPGTIKAGLSVVKPDGWISSGLDAQYNMSLNKTFTNRLCAKLA